MSQTTITLAFEQWKAQQGATGEPVLLDEFVFANVPGLDPDQPVDRNETLPPAEQIVHRQAVSRKGVVNDNAVVHSVVLGADVGDFSFNWIGLLNKASGTLAMIVHAPLQQKLKTAEGQQGNVLTRSFLMEYNGAQAETGINTPAETWQIDFTARMAGMDERQRLENIDIFGAAAFFGDGYLVGKSGNQFYVTKGTGYVAGLRNGAYLSPVNAIHYLAERLAGTGGNTDVVIMMVTGQTHENFMKGLNSLVDVFPAPAFTQVRRLAESAATLATEKMQIPAKAGAGLPVAIPLSVPTSRAALSAAAISEAQKAAGAGFSLDGLKQQLGEFTQLRDSLINDVASGLADLQGKSARAWVFTASGDTAATLLALVKDIPQPSAVYTAAIMLAGKNLDGIRGMIHDVDPDTGA